MDELRPHCRGGSLTPKRGPSRGWGSFPLTVVLTSGVPSNGWFPPHSNCLRWFPVLLGLVYSSFLRSQFDICQNDNDICHNDSGRFDICQFDSSQFDIFPLIVIWSNQPTRIRHWSISCQIGRFPTRLVYFRPVAKRGGKVARTLVFIGFPLFLRILF